ncbi:universal stress protein [Celeribacter sp.]|uniref:universal stress protein n=1 Tax=Celeribacter sp. TaxID=1890673 RepID=UPI003A8DE5E9
MTKTILCAIDVNRPEDETRVLSTAFNLAQAEGAQLDVISVIPDFGMSVVGGFFKEGHSKDAKKHAKELLNDLVTKVVGEEANAKTRHIVGVGSAYHEILLTAEKADADLIVLGAHRPDLKDYLLGPNAARVVRHAKCSVYVVR